MIEDTSLIIGVFIGVIGLVVALFLYILDKTTSYITTNLKHEINDTKKDIQNDIGDINTEVNRIQADFFSGTLPTQSYLAILTSEWEFWEKLFKNRKDKIAISTKIVDKFIDRHDQVIIDSGTTIDQIPRILNQKFTGKSVDLKIYTNNIIAAISVIPPKIKVYLLNGEIDEIYGATYHKKRISQPLDNIAPSKIILAATLITFEDGPLVSTRDNRNKDFKRALIDKALDSNLETCVLIIAADWTKFIDSIPPNNTHQKVIDNSDVWDRIKKNKNFILCLTYPPLGDTSDRAVRSNKIIKQFVENGKNGSGMKVVYSGI
ncbi:MAG TPA: hypothetical protein PLC90_12010 [Bacteroidales bacterium]|nr:hypothetical protein [Bacteroidales bacterium]